MKPVGDGSYPETFDTREKAKQHMEEKGYSDKFFEIVEFPGADDFDPTFRKEFKRASDSLMNVAVPMTRSEPPKKD
jgi:hypothetical protein